MVWYGLVCVCVPYTLRVLHTCKHLIYFSCKVGYPAYYRKRVDAAVRHLSFELCLLLVWLFCGVSTGFFSGRNKNRGSLSLPYLILPPAGTAVHLTPYFERTPFLGLHYKIPIIAATLSWVPSCLPIAFNTTIQLKIYQYLSLSTLAPATSIPKLFLHHDFIFSTWFQTHLIHSLNSHLWEHVDGHSQHTIFKMEKQEVEFKTIDGLTLRGDLYPAPASSIKGPAVVITPGVSLP